jgi:Na+/melibiose symporter-like transporter
VSTAVSWLAIEKMAFALGALVVGIMFALFGFKESNNGVHVFQTPTAILGIAVTYCGGIMLIYLASILAVRRVAEVRLVSIPSGVGRTASLRPVLKR